MNPDSNNGSPKVGITSKWLAWEPRFLSVLRIVVALMFVSIGYMKLFGGQVDLMSLIGLAGILEFFGGLLILVGLYTRPVAFILSGEMAFAYFMGHVAKGFWPVLNGGQPAVLYCFIFLYMSAVGAGVWSLDRAWRKKD